MIRFTALPSATVALYRSGAADAYGNAPERGVAEGPSDPCRHCLAMIPEGAAMLILAHRPFAALQPYAETGPIFLCADDCPQGGGVDLPEMLASPEYIVRAYGPDERIRYGTGVVIPRDAIRSRAEDLLADPETAFVDIRSASNNCFQCRVTRG